MIIRARPERDWGAPAAMNDYDKALTARGSSEDRVTDPATPDLICRIARRGCLARLEGITVGRLTVRDGSGSVSFGQSAPDRELDIQIRVDDPSAWLDLASGGTIGAAEAYMQGKWHSNDLAGIMRLLAVNRQVMDGLEGGLARISQPLLRLAHWVRRNSRRGSRRNIHAHYDLGDELFSLFLDPTMMYSSAVYPAAHSSLETAAVHKLDLICRKLALGPDDHLLEIGTGWGGLALHAAKHYGCRVTTTTISANQLQFARRRVAEAGLGERVKVISQDYRDLSGQYDKLVSVEMIEAVGLRYLDTYFRACSERLKPCGRMLLQAIVIADRHYDQARRSVDFIQKYIFPGGALPSMAALMQSVARVSDLQITDLHDIGLDYARTLEDWRARFLARLNEVRALGYPDEFIRMWEWYLAYCEGGFRERATSAVQVVFDKPASRLHARLMIS